MLKDFKESIKKILRKAIYFFSRKETGQESKEKWDNLAKENARYFILSDKESENEEDFKKTGEKDYNEFILNDQIIKEKFVGREKRVLEIGCGIGRMTEFFAEDFKKVYGVDISKEMIKKGKEKLAGINNIELLETDGVNLPFADNSMDLIFSYIVFQHMPNYEIVEKNFREIKRVLKEDGLFKVQLRGIPAKRGTWYYGVDYNIDSAQKLIRKIGFKLIHYDGINTKYFWLWLKNK